MDSDNQPIMGGNTLKQLPPSAYYPQQGTPMLVEDHSAYNKPNATQNFQGNMLNLTGPTGREMLRDRMVGSARRRLNNKGEYE